MRLYVPVNDSVLVQETQTLKGLKHNLFDKVRFLDLSCTFPVNVSKMQFAHFLLVGTALCLLDEIDKVLEVALALLDSQVYEIPVFFPVVVVQQVWMQIDFLKELNFVLCDVVVLYEHALNSYVSAVDATLEHYSAPAAQSENLALLNHYLTDLGLLFNFWLFQFYLDRGHRRNLVRAEEYLPA